MKARINFNREALVLFCQRRHIRRLALFGSVLREDFGPQSDVDALVEFEPTHKPGFLQLAAMERELSEILGRKADLRTPQELSKLFRDEVIAEAEVLYAA
jgi:predicted nucleotidyltransferase